MKQIAAIPMICAGVLAALFGLLFLVGSGGQATRLVVGAASLLLGAVGVGFGVRLVKQASAESPRQLIAEIMALAKREDGEVSEEEIVAALGARADKADEILASLMRSGTCERTADRGGVFYVFPELQPRLHVRRCEYCMADLPLSQEVGKCPQCGGEVRVHVERRSVAGEDIYRMDE
jgi:Zn finger protein HypA/HybF involved in hydrogenase expression